MSHQGKIYVITGGATGIGLAASERLAAAGAKIVIGNRSEDAGNAAVDKIKSSGGEAAFQQTDVTQSDQVEALVAKAVSEYGQVDGAFLNAGIEQEMSALHEVPDDLARKIIDINVLGVFYGLKHVVAQLLKQGSGGAIVNNSSILGLKAVPNLSVYNASKFAVVGLTKSAGLDYAQQGIRVNAVAPGPVETRMLNDIAGGNPHEFAEFVPMGRIGQPHEIAAAVDWLLSDDSSFVTGLTVPVDGGWNAQ